MKKIEKIVSTAFAVLLAFSFVGCKNDNLNKENSSSNLENSTVFSNIPF